MQRTFRDHVDTLQRDGGQLGVTFARRRVRYTVPPSTPEDVAITLGAAKRTGFLVAVTYDVDTLEISDVVRV